MVVGGHLVWLALQVIGPSRSLAATALLLAFGQSLRRLALAPDAGVVRV